MSASGGSCGNSCAVYEVTQSGATTKLKLLRLPLEESKTKAIQIRGVGGQGSREGRQRLATEGR